ncbi:MAG: hypothetical protein R3B09_07775 [Nannocystaceae bacterium]
MDGAADDLAFVLAGELLRVLPEGKLRRATSFYRVAMLVILATIVVRGPAGPPASTPRSRSARATTSAASSSRGQLREPDMMLTAAPGRWPAAGAPGDVYGGESFAEAIEEMPKSELEADDEAGGGGQRHKGEEG